MLSFLLISSGITILVLVFISEKITMKSNHLRKIAKHRVSNLTNVHNIGDINNNSLFVIVDSNTKKYKTIVQEKFNHLN